jgi:hypothetical protein
MNTNIESISSPKRLARIASIFYLLVVGVRTVKPDKDVLAVAAP